MLAPQSERLPAGPLLDICLESRGMYGEWIKGVERGAMEASGDVHRRGEGYKYLWQGGDDDSNTILNGNSYDNNNINNGNKKKMEPWETGFHCTGGFLAPAFAGDAVATWSPQPDSGKAYWLDEIQVRELEPMLHPNVIGGWWFPEDASVDARRLTCSLRAACVGAGVQMQFGQEYEVKSLEMSGGKCNGVHLANGKVYQPKSLVVANGSWMRHLLPLPVTPHKGQSFSLRMDANAPPILSRVLFAQDTYIVPKADGRIIVGATVEPGTYDGSITPSGMLHCMSEATRLVPALADLPIEEQWAGLRPTTPDKCPLLGGTEQWDNVYLAGGYWRNGVLLAPKTGQLVGDLIVNDGNADRLPPKDQALLQAFSWERFTTPGGGKALAANARYAATFYPVHKRSTTGIAASVGTELGQAMFGLSAEDEDALERAAGMGIGDAEAFSFGDESDGWMKRKGAAATNVDDADQNDRIDMEKISAEPDALTVGVKEEEDEYANLAQEWSDAQTNADDGDDGEDADDTSIKSDLSSIYEKIKANKAKASESMEMGEDSSEEREDPGFRIYHVDKETREETEVPPFTSPGEFFEMKEKSKLSSGDTKPASSDEKENAEDGPPLFDGYTAIREAYGGRTTEEETAEATRSARMRNRAKVSEIDDSKIGAVSSPGNAPPAATSATTASSPTTKKYEKVRSEKAKAWVTEMNGSSAEDADDDSLDDGSDEKTYDGYQAIMSANASSSREEELAKMKAARMANRAKADRIDPSFKL
jgi:glycine/D-amino acid oxidase-like deaminating enzyme